MESRKNLKIMSNDENGRDLQRLKESVDLLRLWLCLVTGLVAGIGAVIGAVIAIWK